MSCTVVSRDGARFGWAYDRVVFVAELFFVFFVRRVFSFTGSAHVVGCCVLAVTCAGVQQGFGGGGMGGMGGMDFSSMMGGAGGMDFSKMMAGMGGGAGVGGGEGEAGDSDDDGTRVSISRRVARRADVH